MRGYRKVHFLGGLIMLSNERMGEIALAIMKLKLKKEGFQPNDMKRNLSNTANEMGIPPEELMEYSEILVREMVEETFAKKK